MHVVFFGVKRVHLQTLRVARTLLRGKELTPARFDMMRIIELHRVYGVAQQKIQALLGVSAPTVSRMLKSLEQLGHIARVRMAHDGRSRIVQITAAGLERVRAARRALVDSGVADRLAERGLDFNPEVARPKISMMRRFLSSIRKVYGCSAAFEHPWTTDDLVPYVFHTIVDGRLCYGAPFKE